jgi:hypothetical protein
VFCPVPFYAWSEPLLARSVDNKQWGLQRILDYKGPAKCIAVNAFWQSTDREQGPQLRCNPGLIEDGSMWRALLDAAAVVPNTAPPQDSGHKRFRMNGDTRQKLALDVLQYHSLQFMSYLEPCLRFGFAAVVGRRKCPADFLLGLSYEKCVRKLLLSQRCLAKLGAAGLPTSLSLHVIAEAFKLVEGGRGHPPPNMDCSDAIHLDALLLMALDLQSNLSDDEHRQSKLKIKEAMVDRQHMKAVDALRWLLLSRYKTHRPQLCLDGGRFLGVCGATV